MGFLSRARAAADAFIGKSGDDTTVSTWKAEQGWQTLDSLFGLPGLGRTLTPGEAIRLSAFAACLDVIGQDIGKTPCYLYERLPNGGRRRVADHPVAKMLSLMINPRQTRSEFFHQLIFNLKPWGNGYILKDETTGGTINGLYIAPSARTTMHVTQSDTFAYWVSPAGDLERTTLSPVSWRLSERQVIHLRQRSFNGQTGLGALDIGNKHLALSAKIYAYREQLYENNGAINGVLSRDDDKAISEEAWERLKDELRSEYRAFKDNKRPLVLDGGVKYKSEQMDAGATGLGDALDRELAEAARLFRVPQHKVGLFNGTKYDNVEPAERAYIFDTLDPTMVDIELAFAVGLLSPEEREKYFFEFDRDRLQIVDSKTKADIASKLFESGVIDRNEARGRLGLNPSEFNLWLVRGNQATVNPETGEVTYPKKSEKGDSVKETE